ncbi:MAG TPA: hypothetical protein DDW50_21170 [Firmicutes bacterium]|jgi:hypothetical protein|nr:hypothetical protein [Bacillota bacterium]
MTTPECFGCGASVPGGMLILGQYLCPSCEEALLKAEVGKLEYQNWIDKCKRFWEKTKIQVKDLKDEA